MEYFQHDKTAQAESFHKPSTKTSWYSITIHSTDRGINKHELKKLKRNWQQYISSKKMIILTEWHLKRPKLPVQELGICPTCGGGKDLSNDT